MEIVSILCCVLSLEHDLLPCVCDFIHRKHEVNYLLKMRMRMRMKNGLGPHMNNKKAPTIAAIREVEAISRYIEWLILTGAF